MTQELLFDKSGHVATLTINRPERRNPLGQSGDGEWFAKTAAAINGDMTIRCAILTGAGTAFSAGGDLKAMRDRSGEFAGTQAEVANRYRTGIHRIIRSLWTIEVPLIAAVNGPAIGLGNDVACLADVRIAAESARFGATFLKVGLVPGDGGAWILPKIVGVSRAAELLFSARVLDAGEALAWGLVSRIVADEELAGEARDLAAQIAEQPPQVLRMTKKLLRTSLTADLDTIMELSAVAQAAAHFTADHREALEAFFAKRAPVFTGK